MLKKSITIVICLVIFSALIVGGIYRTRAVYGINLPSGNDISVEAEVISETVNLQVVVEKNTAEILELRLNDGSLIEVEGRTLSYLAEQGFIMAIGDALSLTGFYEAEDSFEISHIDNLSSGEMIDIRDSSGKPMWGKGGGSH